MKKDYTYTLFIVLEFVFTMFLFFKIAELAMWLMNKASSLANIGGTLLLIANIVTAVFYIYGFGNRIHKYIDKNL
jgi:predicted membrane protein